ncbi:MAG: hypothetical protein ABR962_01380 [Candidatus Bathyarchaeia archaeon]|jgi:hypothetical protein
MSRTVKRRVSSLSFSVNRLYRTITNAKPSNLLIPTLAIAFAVFLFAGGVYDLIQRPLAAVYYNNRFLFLNPYLSEQFVSDSIVAATIYSLGVIGLIVVYQSTRYVYKPRQAYMMLIIGLALALMAYIFLELTIHIKLSGGA